MSEPAIVTSKEPDSTLHSQVESHRNLVLRWAWRYSKFGVPIEDLVSAGNCGLVEAALRFDGTRGATFGSYALWWVRKRIIDALHEGSHNVGSHFSRKRRASLEAVRQGLAERLGAEPEVADLAREIGWRAQTVQRSLEPAARLVPLDPKGDGLPSAEIARVSMRRSESPLDRMIMRDGVRRLVEALSTLPGREATVLLMRYGFSGERPATLRRISTRLGVSSERVRQIELAAIRRLRRALIR